MEEAATGIYYLLSDLIGIPFSTDPYGYICCCFIIIWIIYNAFNLIYKVFRL